MINDKKQGKTICTLQTILLGITTVAVTFTLGKSIINPEVTSARFTDYKFPESIALSQWESSSSKPVESYLTPSISGKFISGKHYRYRQNEKSLEIEMRYIVDTNGDLKTFITNRTGELSPGLRSDGADGFYSVYVDGDKVNLSACINPSGGSTVTDDGFRRNRMLYDNHLKQIVPWLLGKRELRDKRCLWTHLSMALDRDVSIEENYRVLETVWFDWYDLWKSHYPKV